MEAVPRRPALLAISARRRCRASAFAPPIDSASSQRRRRIFFPPGENVSSRILPGAMSSKTCRGGLGKIKSSSSLHHSSTSISGRGALLAHRRRQAGRRAASTRIGSEIRSRFARRHRSSAWRNVESAVASRASSARIARGRQLGLFAAAGGQPALPLLSRETIVEQPLGQRSFAHLRQRDQEVRALDFRVLWLASPP